LIERPLPCLGRPQRGGLREKLRNLNPFAPKKNDPIR